MTETDWKAEKRVELRAVLKQRQAFRQSQDSAFVKAMKSAMSEYRGMRDQGVSREDAIKGIEAVLRDAWPKAPSKFHPGCSLCDDTGWREHVCQFGARCGRERCAHQPASEEHAYVTVCGCPAGDTHRPKARAAGDEIAAVGRTRKPKSERGWRPVGA